MARGLLYDDAETFAILPRNIIAMPYRKTLVVSAAILTSICCAAAHATPLTYTVTFTEDDNFTSGGPFDSTGTAQFTIDSSLITPGQNVYTSTSDISAFSATFYNVGGAGITDSFDLADLSGVEIFTDTANSPPFDLVYFDTTDSSEFVDGNFVDGNDYMTGLAGETLQTLQNDTTGLDIWYDETITAATAVPEPASLALLSLGVMGLAMVRRRRRT
jgi:hypothetical protein